MKSRKLVRDALSVVVVLLPAVGLAGYPGNGTDDLSFDPGNDATGSVNLLGVDLNELYGVTQPFVNYANPEIYAGEHYIPNFHLFPAADQVDQVQENMQYARYVVYGDPPFQPRTYTFADEGIATTWDAADDDPLECGDFFSFLCPLAVGIPEDHPMIAWLATLPPLPPGHYEVELYAAFEEEQWLPHGVFPPGESFLTVFEFDVLAGNRPR